MQAEILAPESEDFRSEQSEITPNALAILVQSEHAAMVSTANLPSNRRKLKDFDDKLMAYANHSQPVALSMFYSLPRAGKQIIGASIRFAEIVAPCWKNCAVASRVVGDATDTVTAQGIFIDYEANLRNSIEVPRRITDKNGNRYNADMIVTTSNAAMSIARRNAVLKGGVPQALWSPAYEAAQLTAVGKAVSHAQRVADAMEYLMKLGVTELQALNAVECPSVKDLEIEHLVTLRVLCGEIKRGDKTIEEVFGSPLDKEIDALLAQLGKNSTQQRMLKDSYAGRTKELLDYLKGQIAPQRSQSPQSVADAVAQKSTPVFNEKHPAAEQDKTPPAAPAAPVKRGRGRPKKVTLDQIPDRFIPTGPDDPRLLENFVPPTTEAAQDGTLPADIDPTGNDQEDSVQDEGAAATQVAGSAFDLV
jgi:hypothetical protein